MKKIFKDWTIFEKILLSFSVVMVFIIGVGWKKCKRLAISDKLVVL